MPIPQSAIPLLAGLILAALLLLSSWRLRTYRSWQRAFAALATALLLVAAYTLNGRFDDFTKVSIPAKVLLAIALILAAYGLLQFIELTVWDVLLTRRLARPLPRLLVNIFNGVGLAFAVLTVLKVLGIIENLSAVAVTSTLASAIIGLALQDVLRNVIAGVALQIEAPFSPGDWVLIAGHEGRVMQLNWRTLTIQTRTHSEVILPNTKVTDETVVNFTRPDPLQAIDLFIDVAESHPPGQVKQILAEAAAEADGVLDQPAPDVNVQNYGDSAITYRIRYWLTNYAASQHISDAVMTNTWYRLKRAGFSMPTLTRDVRVYAVPPDQATKARTAGHQAVVAALRPLPLLAPLSNAEIGRVADHAALQVFTAGETLFRAGDAGDSLFVIQSGRLSVLVPDESGRPVTVAHRGPGEFIGEMSLLTGTPRSATVVAEAETAVIELGHDAFAEVLMADPQIAEGLSETLAARMAETQAQLSAAEAAAEAEEQARLKAGLAVRIRGFFGLG